MSKLSWILLALTCLCACQPDSPQYDLIIRNGVLYDGSILHYLPKLKIYQDE